MSDDQRTTIRFSDVTYSFDDGSIIRDDGTNLELRPQSVEVLAILARNAGDIVSKDTLITNVWPGLNVTDDSLVQCIADIRRAIGEDGHRIIKTIPKKGYRLVASDVSPPKAEQKNHRRLLALAALCVGGLAIGGLWWAQSPRQTVHDVNAIAAIAVKDRGPSIAVLPFEDLTGDERWAKLGRGIGAEISGELARNDWLFVIAPETAQNRANQSEPTNIGRDLSVRLVLSGTIQSEAQTLRITARLADTVEGQILWSNKWNGPLDSVFSIQDEIVARIGSSLTDTFSGQIGQVALLRAKEKSTANLTAYEMFLSALELQQTFAEDDLKEAISILEKVVEFEPQFAKAWAMMSVAKLFYADYQLDQSIMDDLMSQSHADAKRGYEEDPNDPDVLWRMSNISADLGLLEEAGRFMLRAIEEAPNSADVLAIAGGNAYGEITPEMALDFAKRAMELNPDHPDWYWMMLGEAAFDAGDYQLSHDAYERGPNMVNASFTMAVTDVLLGNIGEGKIHAKEFRDMAPSLTIKQMFLGREDGSPEMIKVIEAAKTAGIPYDDSDVERMASQ